ncbi:MAG: 6-carboxytetrahydropterin synthase, partial [Aquificaceae bacterium]|nr:6-carboxytetrahydropterin synthase [Aquificaceae bacterium]
MKWQITKTFRFEAGHRVWKQNLTCGRGAELT